MFGNSSLLGRSLLPNALIARRSNSFKYIGYSNLFTCSMKTDHVCEGVQPPLKPLVLGWDNPDSRRKIISKSSCKIRWQDDFWEDGRERRMKGNGFTIPFCAGESLYYSAGFEGECLSLSWCTRYQEKGLAEWLWVFPTWWRAAALPFCHWLHDHAG